MPRRVVGFINRHWFWFTIGYIVSTVITVVVAASLHKGG